MAYGLLYALMVVTCMVALQAKSSGIIQYKRHVYHPKAGYFLENLHFPPSNKITVHYTLTYNTTKCCPLLGYWRLTDGLEERLLGEGYHDVCQPEDFENVALYSSTSIYGKAGFPNSGCHLSGTMTKCVGSRTVVVPGLESLNWAFVAAYECKHQQNLDLVIDMEIEFTNLSEFMCEPMQVPYCKDHFGYNMTAFPNAFAQETQVQANKVIALVLRAAPLFNCYQHYILLMCHEAFPDCRNGKQYIPCLQMCREFAEACWAELKLVKQPFHCESNPDTLDPNICLYKPIVCPTLQSPTFGSVSIEGHSLFNLSKYWCDEGYKLQGEAVRQCEASGKWNSTTPTCVLIHTQSHNTVLISTFIPVLFITVLVILCVYYCRENIKLLVLFYCYRPFGRMEGEKKLFIAYSCQDREKVSDEFVPRLRQRLRGWTVQTYQDDFTAGRPILDCIKEGVWESQAVLVLLTENFMTSAWCLHEFIEAETRSALDDGFKLIVVMFTQDNQGLPVELLEGLPDSLKRYIRTRIYLGLWEPLFWNKLQQGLAS